MSAATKKTNALRHGLSGYDSDIGSITTEKQYRTLQQELQSALDCGAIISAQSTPVGAQDGYFLPATLLTDVTTDMPFLQEEIFGPLLPIVKVSSEDEAIAEANKSQYGLTASVWTRNRRRGFQVAEKLQAGVVCVNDHLYTHGMPQLEWGGVKESGVGRTHGTQGLLEVTSTKIINVEMLPGMFKRNSWWFPFDERTYKNHLAMTAYEKPHSVVQWLVLNITILPTALLRQLRKWNLK